MDRKEKLLISSGQHSSGAQLTFTGSSLQRLQQEGGRGFQVPLGSGQTLRGTRGQATSSGSGGPEPD